jgi:hypothetical protein
MALDIEYCYALGLHAECHNFFVIMLNVVMVSAVMLNVVAPFKIDECENK